MALKLRRIGAEFQVNLAVNGGTEGLSGTQDYVHVAALTDGRFAAVYDSHFSLTDTDVLGHIFNKDGTPAGSTLTIGYTTYIEHEAVIAPRSDGGFLTVFATDLLTSDPSKHDEGIALRLNVSHGHNKPIVSCGRR